MPAPRIRELCGVSPRYGCVLRRAHLQDPRRYASDHGKVGNIVNNHCVRTDDDIVTDAYATEDLGTCPQLDTVADGGRAERIIQAGVTEGHTMAEHTVIADDRSPVHHYAAMMLDAQSAADPRCRSD